MRVINPLADIGSMIIWKVDEKVGKIDKPIIKLQRTGNLMIKSKDALFSFDLHNHTGEGESFGNKMTVFNISFKLVHDCTCGILKLEFDVEAAPISGRTMKHYLLIIFKNLDFDYIIKSTKLEVNSL